MVKKYKYDVWEACIKYDVSRHPQAEIKRLGFHPIRYEPCPIAECWFFWAEDDIKELPGYVVECN